MLSGDGIRGVLVKVEPMLGDTSGPVNLDVDYRSFGDAYGGDFGGRLHLVQYPSCLLTTPDKPECHVGTPLASANNTTTRHVAADVPLERQSAAAASTLVAAEADTKGGGGDFGATDLKPVGSCSAGVRRRTSTTPIRSARPPRSVGPVLRSA